VAQATVVGEGSVLTMAATVGAAAVPALRLAHSRDGCTAHAFLPAEDEGGGRWVRTDEGAAIICDGGGLGMVGSDWRLVDTIGGAIVGMPIAGVVGPREDTLSTGAAAERPERRSLGLPPMGRWRVGDEVYELSIISEAALKATRKQERLRPWREWLGHLESVVGGPLAGVIFDLGCGAGTLAELVTTRAASQNVQVVGLDLDPIAVAAAKTRSPTACFRTADVGQVHTRPQDAGVASGVWASFVAAHFPTPGLLRKAVAGWSWLLRPGGWMCLVDLEGLFSSHRPFSEMRWQKDFRELDDDLAELAKFDPFVGKKLAEQCQHCGLEVLSQKEWDDQEFVFSGPAGPKQLAAWTARLDAPHMKNILKRRFRAFAAEAREAFLQVLKSPDHTTRGKVHVVICRKPDPAADERPSAAESDSSDEASGPERGERRQNASSDVE